MPWFVGGAALLGGALSADATRQASKGQNAAAQQAAAEQARQYDLSRSDLAPARDAGNAALTKLRDLLGISTPKGNYGSRSLVDVSSGRPAPVGDLYASDPSYKKAWDDFANVHQQMFKSGYTNESDPLAIEREVRSRLPQDTGQATSAAPQMSVGDIMALDPGYQFRLDQGIKAGTNLSGARGMLNSGATGKALTRYGQDYASGEFGNIYNRLAGVAGIGQNATNTGVQAGQNYAGNVGNLYTGAANARGAAAIGGANSWNNAFNTVGNYFGQQNTLDKIIASRNTGYGGFGGSSPY